MKRIIALVIYLNVFVCFANINTTQGFYLDFLSKKEISLNTFNDFQQLESDSILEKAKKYSKLKLFSYSLLVLLVILSVILISIYFKRKKNIKYTRKLEEINRAFLKQTEHLEKSNNVKDKLFSIVSHDLKDSLSSINGFIDLLKEGALSEDEFNDLIPELSKNASNATSLLFNLLNWSKSQMQSLKPKPILFNIEDVFSEKTKLIEQRLKTKHVSITNNITKDFIYADKNMFGITIQNLLANALKYSKKNEQITISNYTKNNNCIISISDTGIGISKKNMAKLFITNSFITVGTNNEKGVGLGLSICKELIELNNGEIWAESTKNVGSTFYIKLPKFEA